MSIQTTDIVPRLSVKTGAAGDSTASTPAASLGKYVSTTAVDLGTLLNNLFDDVAGAESSAGDTEYRCFFILNNHASLAAQTPKIWVRGQRFAAVGSTDVFTSAAHGFSNGDKVRVEAEYATDTLPTGVDNSTDYFIRDVTTDTYKLAATLGGAAIDITTDGGGSIRPRHVVVSIGLDPAGVTAKGSASAQAAEIADESSAPAGVSFSEPITKAGGLSPANVPAGSVVAVWVRRVVAASSTAKNNDGPNIRFECDTAA